MRKKSYVPTEPLQQSGINYKEDIKAIFNRFEALLTETVNERLRQLLERGETSLFGGKFDLPDDVWKEINYLEDKKYGVQWGYDFEKLFVKELNKKLIEEAQKYFPDVIKEGMKLIIPSRVTTNEQILEDLEKLQQDVSNTLRELNEHLRAEFINSPFTSEVKKSITKRVESALKKYGRLVEESDWGAYGSEQTYQQLTLKIKAPQGKVYFVVQVLITKEGIAEHVTIKDIDLTLMDITFETKDGVKIPFWKLEEGWEIQWKEAGYENGEVEYFTKVIQDNLISLIVTEDNLLDFVSHVFYINGVTPKILFDGETFFLKVNSERYPIGKIIESFFDKVGEFISDFDYGTQVISTIIKESGITLPNVNDLKFYLIQHFVFYEVLRKLVLEAINENSNSSIQE